jgi:hypothetical protein
MINRSSQFKVLAFLLFVALDNYFFFAVFVWV